MCARFTLKTASDVIATIFDLDEIPELEARYNIAPTQDVVAVVERSGVRQIRNYRWGLIPNWTDDPGLGARMINARSETVFEKPAFKAAVRSRRCLVIADGYYEWTDPDGDTLAYVTRQSQVEQQGHLALEGISPARSKKLPRQPWWIGMADGSPFAFAGIWEFNDRTHLGKVRTCAILTTEPNELLQALHDRMPVILAPESWEAWLDPDLESEEAVVSMCVPFRSTAMKTYKVSPRVNSPDSEGADLLLAIA